VTRTARLSLIQKPIQIADRADANGRHATAGIAKEAAHALEAPAVRYGAELGEKGQYRAFDITYMGPIRAGLSGLGPVLHSRKIVGWAIASAIEHGLTRH
jgi:hypothetical protein